MTSVPRQGIVGRAGLCLLSGLLCFTGGLAFASCEQVETIAPALRTVVAVDPSVWEPASRIRWPDPADKQVHVYYYVADAVAGLALSEAQAKSLERSPDNIWMGEHHRRLAVLFHAKALIADAVTRRFVTEHEVFHLAAQYYGVRVGLDRLKKQEVSNPQRTRDFWRAIRDTSARLTTGGRGQGCDTLAALFEQLEPGDKAYVLRKAFWEWPAEYYARARVFGLRDDAKYLAFRHAFSPGEDLYIAGGIALAAVERAEDGSQAWQRRVEAGTNPLNIFLEAAGCPPMKDDGGIGRVVRRNFVDPD